MKKLLHNNIYLVVLHYGNIVTTEQCLLDLVPYQQYFSTVVLINNDPRISIKITDLPLKKDKIHVIQTESNLGFAKGVNVGIRYALSKKADYIMLLNNDTRVQTNLIEELYHVLVSTEKAGIVGPIISYKKNDSIVYDMGGYITFPIGRTYHHEDKSISLKTPLVVPYISGCCVLIKKEVFDTVGLFDEQFFLYYEDVDFALRAKSKGFTSIVVPTIVLYHELSKGAGKISYISLYNQTKSGVLFGRKYAKHPANLLFLLVQSLWITIKHPHVSFAVWRGFFDGLVLPVSSL